MTEAGVAKYGCTSMVSPLRRVLVRRPDEDACARWAEFGWRSAPDPVRLLEEHEAFATRIAEFGADVVQGSKVSGGLDAVYTFDPVIVGADGAIVLRPGKELRRPEAAITADDMAAAGIPVAATLQSPATVDGGDTIWLDEKSLLVGRGYRTNAAGVAALRDALPGVEIVEFDLPFFHGAGEVMHLLSLVSPVAPDLAVAYLPLLPVRLVQLLESRGIELVPVPDDEFETMGPNVLTLEPRVVLMLERNRMTRRRLEQAGVAVETYAGVELSKGDGGPTCLTRPLLRD
ncbi:MAG: dimethylarginine dimethylaminohydrolase family protein [Gaiellaceae bacterium]